MTAAIALPVRQRTPEWLEAKKAGIGSSQAAAAIGVSPWQSTASLWAEFLELVPPVEQTPEMELGTLMEPILATLYERATGERLRRANRLLRHPRHDWMLASLDRVRAGRRIVELKHSARGAGYGEPGTDEIPDEVLVQVIHQMAVVDAPEADVAVLVGGRPPVRIYTVLRDHEAEDAVVEREAAFWDAVVRRIEPPVDGSDSTLRMLAERYPRTSGEVVDAGPELRDLMSEWRAVCRNKAQIEVAEKLAKARIEAVMGEVAEAVAPGIGRVTWKPVRQVAAKAVTEGLIAELGIEGPAIHSRLIAEHTKAERQLRRYWEQEEEPDGE